MDTQRTEDEEPLVADEDDTEGHNMRTNPSLAADLTRSHMKDLEREAREQQRARQAKSQPKGR